MPFRMRSASITTRRVDGHSPYLVFFVVFFFFWLWCFGVLLVLQGIQVDVIPIGQEVGMQQAGQVRYHILAHSLILFLQQRQARFNFGGDTHGVGLYCAKVTKLADTETKQVNLQLRRYHEDTEDIDSR